MSETSKTIRSFRCRETLWEKFEEMAGELECSVDYLINDSMKQYARQRGYSGTRNVGTSSSPPSRASGRLPPSSALQGHVTHVPPPPVTTLISRPPASGGTRTPVAPPPPPAPPPNGARPLPPPAPAPITSMAAQHLGQDGRQAGIHIYYLGQRFAVTKERFVIGRGKQTTDLTIKDPNVSRQHAMVEFSAGVYYLVDLGSTNGVEFHGQRIERQPINEGDVFQVCDHELAFSFR